MDPKTAQNLDPKLREVYERVMGTSASPRPAPASPTPSQPMTPPQDTMSKLSTSPIPSSLNSQVPKSAVDYTALSAKPLSSAPVSPTVAAPTTGYVAPQAKTPPPTVGVVNNSTDISKKLENTEKKGSLGKKLLLLIGIPVFILIYTAIWIVVFGVELPFALPL